MLTKFLKDIRQLQKTLERTAGGRKHTDRIGHLCSQICEQLRNSDEVRIAILKLRDAKAEPLTADLMAIFVEKENRILRPLCLSIKNLEKLLVISEEQPSLDAHPADWLADQLERSLAVFAVSLPEIRQENRKSKKQSKKALLEGVFELLSGIGIVVADAIIFHDNSESSYVAGVRQVAKGAVKIGVK